MALITGAGLSIAVATSAQAQNPVSSARERVVVQVSSSDRALWNQAMNYIENLRELYGADKVEIEIVALGLGLGLLKMDSTQGPRVAEALKLNDVRINACQVTMRRQKVTEADMLPNIGYVAAGLGQIIKRQREGWAYISG